jgi:release factor glutamine methyltransferase
VRVGDTLAHAVDTLAAAGVDSPHADAELLLAHVTGLSRTELSLEGDRLLNDNEGARFDALLARRTRREPLAYVLGEWGFRRLNLKVDARVLVPRPETEIVVERCLALLTDVRGPEVLDVGTGSGAIALALADECADARVTAVDASPDALALARENTEATGLADRVRLFQHDLTRGLGNAQYDLVVSNPPYVELDEIETLEPEVRDWEPRAALVAPGLTHTIARAAHEALKPAGWLVVEVHERRADDIGQTLRELGYAAVRITRDLAGRERVVEAQRQ